MEKTSEIKTPTKEEVHGWIKRDISASSYFLSMLLRHPDVIEKIADELFDKIMSEEQGALIDQIVKGKEDKNAN